MGEAYCSNEHYLRVSWIALFVGVIVIMNGWLMFFVFANEIYAIILPDDPVISPRHATYIAGGV